MPCTPRPELSAPHRRPFLRAGLGLAALLGPRLAWAQGRPGGEVLVGGTGSGVEPFKQVMEGRAGLRFVPSLGTGGGLKALAAGAIDIALSVRPLDDGERAQGLVAREWFRTPFVFACNAGVPLHKTTLPELVALYAGRIARWPDGTLVRLVLRPDSDSDTKLVRAISPAMADAVAAAHARPGAHIAVTDLDAVEALERIPGALGVIAMSVLRSDTRRHTVLELDGVKPGLDTLASGRYALGKTLYLVTRNNASADVAAVVAAATAARATTLLAGLGCLAVLRS